jgi:hypothetical protein
MEFKEGKCYKTKIITSEMPIRRMTAKKKYNTKTTIRNPLKMI